MSSTPPPRFGALSDDALEALMRQVVAVRAADARTVVRDAAQTIGEDLERRMRERWGDADADRTLQRLRAELGA